jgi:gamma-glutamyl:cysteine ligase YbdK (ATP-grasp superfamily)
MKDQTMNDVTQLKPAKKPSDILNQIEAEAKEQQFKEFKQKAQEIVKEKAAAEKIIKQCDVKLKELIARFEEGLV